MRERFSQQLSLKGSTYHETTELRSNWAEMTCDTVHECHWLAIKLHRKLPLL